MIDLKISQMPKIELEDVVSIYVGKPGMCYCGCSGKYTYTSKNQEIAGKRRGYEVKDEEVNDKRIERLIKKMSDPETVFINKVIVGKVDGGFIFTIVIGKTEYSMYTL